MCDLGNSEQSIRYHRWGLQVFPVFRTSANPTPATWLGGDENPLHGTLTTCQKEHLWHSDVSFYNTWRWCQFIQFWGLTQAKGTWFICLTSLKTSSSQQLPTRCLIWMALNTCEDRHWVEDGCQRPRICRNEVMKLSYPRTYIVTIVQEFQQYTKSPKYRRNWGTYFFYLIWAREISPRSGQIEDPPWPGCCTSDIRIDLSKEILLLYFRYTNVWA